MPNDAQHFPNRASWIVPLAVALLPLLLRSTTLASEVVVFATGALSASLLLGAAGMLSFGQGLYFGLGAYVGGLLLRDAGADLLVALPLAAVAGAVLALAIGALIVRRQGVYFVMLTLAFAQMGYFAMLAFKDVTGGENGLTGIPSALTLAGIVRVSGTATVYVLLAVVFVLVFLLVQRMLASPLGSVLRAIRDNPGRAAALGYNVRRHRIAAFGFAGGMAGLAGAMQSAFLGFVPPTSIELDMSQRLLIMAIIGGVAAPPGALAGAAFYVVCAELLSALWPRWLALIAVLLIAIVLFLRGGLWSGTGQLLLALRRSLQRA